MKLKLPQYNGKDNQVMLVIVPLFALFFNLVNFQPAMLQDIGHMVAYTLLSVVLFGGYFVACGLIAVYLRNRLPEESQLFKRLAILIALLLLTTALFLRGFLQLAESITWLGYTFSAQAFLWNYIALGIINIFLVFLMEGISRYQDWKNSLLEKEALETAYEQGRLNALKNQVNPHFLFNCLNTLSSLIQENGDEADAFLNEMTKVYRYLLRAEGNQLVAVETELRFIGSYAGLLITRYGESLQIKIETAAHTLAGNIAPLSVQLVIENIIATSSMSKQQPLIIRVDATNRSALIIHHPVQPRYSGAPVAASAGIDNLIKKYALLEKPVTVNIDAANERTVCIPVLHEKEDGL